MNKMLSQPQSNINFDPIKVDGTVIKKTGIEPLENTIGQRLGFSINRFTQPSVYDWMTAPKNNLIDLSKLKDLIGFTYPEKRFEEITKKWKNILDDKSAEAIDFFSQRASEITAVEESFLCGKDDNYTLITLVRTDNLEDEKRIYDIEYDILKKFGKINIDFLVLPFEEVIRITTKDVPLFKRE